MVAASLMCMDLLNVEKQISILNDYCDIYHIDIMDGHFCQNISLSPRFVEVIRNKCKLPIDVHLMVEYPELFIDRLIDAGADIMSFHAETIERNAFILFEKVKQASKKIGIVICPSTSIDSIRLYLPYIDIITVMTVEVGFVGQDLIDETLCKISKLKELKEVNDYSFIIQSDGGAKKETYRKLQNAGAESIVIGGSGLFNKSNDLEIACSLMLREVFEKY